MDSFDNVVRKFSPTGTFLVATNGTSVYVVDTNNNRLQKFGELPVSIESSSWSQIKAAYR